MKLIRIELKKTSIFCYFVLRIATGRGRFYTCDCIFFSIWNQIFNQCRSCGELPIVSYGVHVGWLRQDCNVFSARNAVTVAINIPLQKYFECIVNIRIILHLLEVELEVLPISKKANIAISFQIAKSFQKKNFNEKHNFLIYIPEKRTKNKCAKYKLTYTQQHFLSNIDRMDRNVK